jgi:hypothetical protein
VQFLRMWGARTRSDNLPPHNWPSPKRRGPDLLMIGTSIPGRRLENLVQNRCESTLNRYLLRILAPDDGQFLVFCALQFNDLRRYNMNDMENFSVDFISVVPRPA